MTPTWAAVWLSMEHFRDAYLLALARQMQNIERGAHQRFGETQDMPYTHVLGTVVEKATSLYLGLPWDGALGNYDAADVGQGRRAVQCRGVRRATGPNSVLGVYPWDAPCEKKPVDQPYVLGYWPGAHEVFLRGWQWGGWIKQHGKRREPRRWPSPGRGEEPAEEGFVTLYAEPERLLAMAELKAWMETTV